MNQEFRPNENMRSKNHQTAFFFAYHRIILQTKSENEPAVEHGYRNEGIENQNQNHHRSHFSSSTDDLSAGYEPSEPQIYVIYWRERDQSRELQVEQREGTGIKERRTTKEKSEPF